MPLDARNKEKKAIEFQERKVFVSRNTLVTFSAQGEIKKKSYFLAGVLGITWSDS